MAALTISPIVVTGLDSSALFTAAAGGGDTFVNTGREFIYVKNGDASGITVTFTTAGTFTSQSLALTDPAVSVGATDEMIIGPFDVGAFNNTSGQVAVAYSAVTSVTVAVFQLPVLA